MSITAEHSQLGDLESDMEQYQKSASALDLLSTLVGDNLNSETHGEGYLDSLPELLSLISDGLHERVSIMKDHLESAAEWEEKIFTSTSQVPLQVDAAPVRA